MTLQQLKYADAVATCGSISEGLKFEELFVSHPHVFLGKRHPLAKRKGGVG